VIERREAYVTRPFVARASISAEVALAALIGSSPFAPRLCHAALLIEPSTRPVRCGRRICLSWNSSGPNWRCLA